MPAATPALIIGAGPAGLAVAAALRRHGVAFEMLERNADVASSWRQHYQRLHLHTPSRHSGLPFLGFPAHAPRYPSRDQVIDYFTSYARAFALQPRFRCAVRHCSQAADGHWLVQADGETLRARHLIVATGFNRMPRRPTWPGLESFGGPVLHSQDYVNGERFRGQRVLVVGFGNSGAEIALDLAERGADCTIAIRGAVNVIPRDLLGVPIIAFALASRWLPPALSDRLNALWIRLAVGDLARYGLRRRKDGPSVEILHHGHVPVIDVGTLAQIRSGRIAVRPAVDAFARHQVRFADGTRERFDAVILATGFDTGLAELFPQNAGLLDADGRPRIFGREALPGLYFCGFRLVPTGLLREIAIEARRIGKQVAGRSASTPRTA